MRAELTALAAAWRALTAGAPLPPGAGRHLPAAGLALGTLAALALWAAAHLWPATVAVGVALALPAVFTRGRHEEGLQRAFGTVALVGVIGLKAAALHGLAVRDLGAALAVLPLAHALAPAARVALLAPASPAGGTGAVVAVWCALALAMAAALGVGAVALAVTAAAALAAALAVRRGLGDTGPAAQGTLQQAVEGAVLLALLAQRGG